MVLRQNTREFCFKSIVNYELRIRPTNSSFFQFTARNSDFQFKKQFRILFPQKQFRLNSSFAGKELATRKNNA
jgi:hypothetical protein